MNQGSFKEKDSPDKPKEPMTSGIGKAIKVVGLDKDEEVKQAKVDGSSKPNPSHGDVDEDIEDDDVEEGNDGGDIDEGEGKNTPYDHD